MQTRKALKNLSGNRIDFNRVSAGGPLQQNANWLIEKYNQRKAEIEASRRRHDTAAAKPILAVAQQKLQELIGSKVMPDDTPIATRFDAYSVIKDVSNQQRHDSGLRNLAIHLERLWHKDPLGSISAGAISKLRDHYQYKYPRSLVGEAVDTYIPKVSFKNLPVTKLTRIAAEINNQEDYDCAIVRYGFQTNSSEHVRARTFIRELVNRKEKVLAEKVCDVCSQKECECPTARPERRKDVAQRVADKLYKQSQMYNKHDEDSSDSDDKVAQEDLGIGGTGIMTAALEAQTRMLNYAAEHGLGIPRVAVAPEGWEGTVKKMKKHKDIKDPYALAHWMEAEGFEPHYTEKGKKKEKYKEAQVEAIDECGDKQAYEWGMEWGGGAPAVMNVAETARDILEEMREDPGLMELADPVAQPYMQSEEVAALPPEQQYQMALAMGIQGGGRDVSALMKYYRDLLMAEPVTAQKKEQKSDFEPDVNDQQPNQVKLEENQGLEVLTKEKPLKQDRATIRAFAIQASHSLVDDNCDHLPIDTIRRQIMATKYLNELTETPEWWLGSVDELKQAAFSVKAGELPPALEKFKKEKKDDSGDKKDDVKDSDKKDEEKDKKFPEKKSSLEYEVIEKALLSDGSIRVGKFSIYNDQNSVKIASSKGVRTYPLVHMSDAIQDFLYLANSIKQSDNQPPPSMFYIREGIRLPCPACAEVNSYTMPKVASDLACGSCNTVIPAKVVTAAFGAGIANEENVLVIYAPKHMQNDIGKTINKAAGLLKADSIGANGSRVEVYSVEASIHDLDNAWDFMTESKISAMPPLGSGVLKSWAQIAGNLVDDKAIFDSIEEAKDWFDKAISDGFDVDEPYKDMYEGEEVYVVDLSGALEALAKSAASYCGEDYYGEDYYGENISMDQPGKWADHQMIQAAMMHYEHQGMSAVEAIAQFNKDYGEGFDPETVVQTAATVYDIDVNQVKIGDEIGGLPEEIDAMPIMANKKQADLPATDVNQQQPDTVAPPADDLGPDSETSSDLKEPAKVNQQTPAQSQQGTSQADQTTEPDTSGKDPGDFGAGKPKVQHPITDQQGVTLPADVNLGKDSETQTGKLMKNMDNESSGAYDNVRSK